MPVLALPSTRAVLTNRGDILIRLQKLITSNFTGAYWWIGDSLSGNVGEVTGSLTDRIQGLDITSTGSFRPTISLYNGRKCLLHSGGGEYLSGTLGATITQPFSVITVWSQDAWAAASRYIFDDTVTTVGAYSETNNGRQYMLSGASIATPLGTISLDAQYLSVSVFNGVSSSYTLNGTQVASGNAGSNVLSGVKLGDRRAGSRGWSGKIATHLVLPGAIFGNSTVADIAYLLRKYYSF